MNNIPRQIADLEQALATLPADSPARVPMQQMIAQLRAQLSTPPEHAIADERAASITLGDQVAGDLVLGDKIIAQFFDSQPGEDGAAMLRDYFAALLDANNSLRLSRLTERRQSGSGQERLPQLRLTDVFTSLATEQHVLTSAWRRRSRAQLVRLAERLSRCDRSSDANLPEHVRVLRIEEPGHAQLIELPARALPEQLLDEESVRGTRVALARPELALEALAQQPRLVLLGAPGSGKSTVLRYLALTLVQHIVDPRSPLPLGWESAPVPILCPLGVVAGALARAEEGQSDVATFWQVLEAQLDGAGLRPGLGRYLRPALRNGAAILLLDGLDEIPAAPPGDGPGPRARVSRAIQQLARELPHATRIVVTCRVQPYEQPATHGDWRLPPDDGWATRTIQPFGFGQAHQFIIGWYDAASRTPAAIYTPAEASIRAESLTEQLLSAARLRELTAAPLLLTMLAILHYNKTTGELPHDRARLYDECTQLLLDRWEPVRTPGAHAPGILERIGIAGRASIDDLRAVLHSVAFAAHDRPPSPGDGRGILRGSELEGELSRFLRRLRCDRIEERLAAFEQALHDQIGLLQAVGDDAYMFPHLTFQEYLAACDLADHPQLIERAYRAWSDRDGERWREVILLLMGRLRQQRKIELQGVGWVRALLASNTPSGLGKPARQRQRDTLLAADCYAEWEGRVALSSFDRQEIEHFEQRITRALTSVLVPMPPAPLAERLQAGRHLAALGDPRDGVCTDAPDWCNVPSGPFLLGSHSADRKAYKNEQPQRRVRLPSFRISRYPVTNAQWRRFIAADGYSDQRWWSAAGWAARNAASWTRPAYWGDPRFRADNQPVVGISWYEAIAFCRWLSATLGENVRLPSEAQWEKAARGADGRIYPWGNIWDASKANTRTSDIAATAPVGSFPAGASPCGALDMSGNVFEWTATPWVPGYQQHDGTAYEDQDGDVFVFRGGAWPDDRRYARCAFRYWMRPTTRNNFVGMRVVSIRTPSARGGDQTSP